MADVDTYQQAVIIVEGARRVLAELEIPALLRAIEHAESFGPIFDPTLYREKSQAMAEDKALLKAALPLATFKQAIRAPGVSHG